MNSIEQTHLPDDQDEGRPAVKGSDSSEGGSSPQPASATCDNCFSELEVAVTATARRSKPDRDPVSPGVHWSQQLKVSPANICLPGSPLVAMTPPLMSRLPAQNGILGSLSPECPPSDTHQFSTTAPISLSSPLSPKPPETAALKQPIATRMPDDQTGFTEIPQGVVLDLSGKKRQSQITSVDDVWKVPGAVNDMVIGSDVIGTCFPRDIRSWGVNEVASFVSTIPGCQEYSETFIEHRIDGTSLAHLSEEHLLHVVKMKLGPAIRLRIAVSRLHVSCGV